MGRRRKGRPVNGIFLLDKPQGISSNQALQRVKRCYGAAKAGHTGALDPLATGMLPVALGEATKFSQFLLDADKRYQTTVKLGIRTDSSDADGQVIARSEVGSISSDQVLALLVKHFSGEIEQVPSMFSALKYQGQPLYKLAREGKKVPVKPRKVTIHSARLLALRQDELDLEISCSKGTYIRSIAEDLGLYLGCGAHVQVLRRLNTGPYQTEQMLTLEKLEALAAPVEPDETQESIQTRLDALLLPPWSAVGEQAAQVELNPEQCQRVLHGQSVAVSAAPHPLVRIMAAKTGRFIGMGEITHTQMLVPKRLIAAD